MCLQAGRCSQGTGAEGGLAALLVYLHSMPPVVCCSLPLCLQLKGAQVRLAEVQTDPESEVKRRVRILERKLADIEVSGGATYSTYSERVPHWMW